VPAQAIDATQALNPPANKAAGYIAAFYCFNFLTQRLRSAHARTAAEVL